MSAKLKSPKRRRQISSAGGELEKPRHAVWREPTGRLATQEPEIIELLRTLKNRHRKSAGELAKVDAKIAAWLKQWYENESISDLCLAFGLKQPRRGARRKLRTVLLENQIVDFMVSAALEGSDVSTFRAAADKLGSFDEKQIERAWKEWGRDQIEWLKRCPPSNVTAKQLNAVLSRLPKIDRK